ncbi:MAG: hypothetical protein IPK83_01970 [Planctomycetes bacterium]|nr:hypothetical protein [Planctomycetota bacterium]
MDARFGSAASLDDFQRLAFGGGSALLQQRPADRWRGLGGPLGDANNAIAADRPGAFIDQFAMPLGKYRLPPNEMQEILPQQLLALESAAAALEDAGMALRERRHRAGVIVGMSFDFETTNFHLRWWLEGQARRWAAAMGLSPSEEQNSAWIEALREQTGPALTPTATMGALGNIIASRIAREFQFGGPSFVVSAEAASGIAALEAAVRSLQLGETDAMVVGAVDLAGDVRTVMATGALRPDCAVGEGATSLVLKRLSDATRDGDRVYGVIRGIGRASGAAIGRLDSDEARESMAAACERSMAARCEMQACCDWRHWAS